MRRVVPIPLTDRRNISIVSAVTGIEMDKLQEKIDDANMRYKKKCDIEFAYSFFGKDEKWYNETIQRVKEIAKSIDKDLNYKNRTIKLYGWIADEFPDKNLTIPMEFDKKYAAAHCVELILTNPDLYHKVINWDWIVAK